MKRLYLLCAVALLLLGVTSSAGVIEIPSAHASGMLLVTASGSTPSGEGACSTPTTGDELNEGFLGAGYENTWTEDTTYGTIVEDTTLSGTPPTGSCTEGVKLTIAGGSGYIYWDRGSVIDISANNVDIYFSFYINAWMIDNDQYIAIGATTPVSTGMSTNESFLLRLTENAEALYVRCDGTTTTSEVALSTGTWYEAKIHIDTTAANSYFQLTGGASTTCDVEGECTFTVIDQDARYFWLGPGYGVGAAEAVTMEIGYIYVNTP